MAHRPEGNGGPPHQCRQCDVSEPEPSCREPAPRWRLAPGADGQHCLQCASLLYALPMFTSCVSPPGADARDVGHQPFDHRPTAWPPPTLALLCCIVPCRPHKRAVWLPTRVPG